MRVAGVDPGVTTGVALVEERQVLAAEEVASLLELWTWLEEHRPDLLVVERFLALRFLDEARVLSLEAQGVAHLWSQLRGVPLRFQTSSQIAGYARRIPFSSPHVRDAVAHALYAQRIYPGSLLRMGGVVLAGTPVEKRSHSGGR